MDERLKVQEKGSINGTKRKQQLTVKEGGYYLPLTLSSSPKEVGRKASSKRKPSLVLAFLEDVLAMTSSISASSREMPSP